MPSNEIWINERTKRLGSLCVCESNTYAHVWDRLFLHRDVSTLSFMLHISFFPYCYTYLHEGGGGGGGGAEAGGGTGADVSALVVVVLVVVELLLLLSLVLSSSSLIPT